MSCRTSLLRGARPLRGMYTGLGRIISIGPPVGAGSSFSDQREDLRHSFFLDKLKRRANAPPHAQWARPAGHRFSAPPCCQTPPHRAEPPPTHSHSSNRASIRRTIRSCAILSPALISTAAALRFVITTLISPRYPGSITPASVRHPRAPRVQTGPPPAPHALPETPAQSRSPRPASRPQPASRPKPRTGQQQGRQTDRYAHTGGVEYPDAAFKTLITTASCCIASNCIMALSGGKK